MGLFCVLLLASTASLQMTMAGPVGTDQPFEFLARPFTGELPKPKNVDMTATTTLIRAVMTEAQGLLNPCNLVDIVKEDVRKAPQKSKLKPTGVDTQQVTRRMVLDMALPAIREGISLYRTMFVLQETANLTVFLDQNRDEIYSNTSLRSYSHYYVRAANDEITQILFIGLIKNDDLLKTGTEGPAMDFLSANGLIRHPRQYVDFEIIPRPEAQLIMQKRQQMADLLAGQGTYWEDDIQYLTNIITVAFNGPENDKEFSQTLPKVIKNYVHSLQQSAPKLGDKYEEVCLRENLQKAADQASMEALALFAL